MLFGYFEIVMDAKIKFPNKFYGNNFTRKMTTLYSLIVWCCLVVNVARGTGFTRGVRCPLKKRDFSISVDCVALDNKIE